MEQELKSLKSVLRSLVVSSPSQMDVHSLARDYRNMMGKPIPLAQFGYRDIVSFLKEQCGDSFLGNPLNPVLTLIVSDTLKHIDQFVQRQKCTTATKLKGKRRSVEFPSRHPEKPKFDRSIDMICETFKKTPTLTQNMNGHNPEVKSNYHPPEIKPNRHTPKVQSNHNPPQMKSNYNPKSNNHPPEVKSNYRPIEVKSTTIRNSNNMYENRSKEMTKPTSNIKPDNNVDSDTQRQVNKSNNNVSNQKINESSSKSENRECSEPDRDSSKGDNDSGRQTLSSKSSTKKAELDKVLCEVHELIKEHENGVLCTDILRLYRERYSRELDLSRLGQHNINSVLYALEERVCFVPEARGVRVRAGAGAGAGGARRARPPAPAPPAPRAAPPPVDPDDALPGIAYEPDVFPEDSLTYMDSIPTQSLADVSAGAMLEVTVGEVYSPSHFWLQRLGPEYSQRMDDIMDEMLWYYGEGPGRERVLARGARRTGTYCASLYERDWHRSVIVRVLDADTVKVRHVDYGTVETVPAAALKPLLRRWSALPAQAARARLAGLRPAAAARRWPHAAAAHFLALVQDRRFVANIVAVDLESETVETFLIDTSGAEDVCVASEMIRSGHAEPRGDSALRSVDWYLFPNFVALESGDTPNYAEIHRYLADGVALEYVESYRSHVPVARCTEPAAPSDSRSSSQHSSPAPSSPEPCSPASLVSASTAPAVSIPDSAPSVSIPDFALCVSIPDSAPCVSIPDSAPCVSIPDSAPCVSVPETAPCVSIPSSAQFASIPSLAQFVSIPAPAPCVGIPNPAQFVGVPGPAPPPPAGPPGGAPWGAGELRLSVAECDMYSMLSALDPEAAHCYMLSTLRRSALRLAPRAQAPPGLPAPPHFSLNPQAPEFRFGFPPSPAAYVPPPPGYSPAPAYAPPMPSGSRAVRSLRPRQPHAR